MLNPWMLIGLAGLAVPVILHLIQRQKLQPHLLATLRFLDPGDAANAFKPVPRDLLQLLLRLLLLTLFVLLMARLLLPAPTTGPRALVVILDQSMSMQRNQPDGRTLFEACRGQLLDLIGGMRRDDRLSLMLVGDTLAAETGFLADPQRLRQAAEGFAPGEAGGSALLPAITRAVRQLSGRREVNSAVIVFTDRQAVNFSRARDADELRAALARGRVQVVLVGEAVLGADNLAIEEAAFTPAQVHLGAGGRLTATVRNLAAETRLAEVRFREGEAAGESRSISLAPGEAAQVDLGHVFESPADVACAVEIGEDDLAADNVFHAPMRLRDRRQILLVAPPADVERQGITAGFAGVDLLAYAMNPGEALGAGAGTHVSVKRVTTNLLERVSLPLYSTIVVYGIAQLPERAIHDLEAYVRNGGGLWIIPAPGLSPVQINDGLGPLLAGFQFGALKELADPAQLGRDEGGLASDLLLPLIRDEWGKADEAVVLRHFAVEARGAALAALRTAAGDPLALVIPVGAGRILVQTVSWETTDSSLAREVIFVPLVQHVLEALDAATAAVARDVARVNEQIRLQLPELRGLDGPVQLDGPAPAAADLRPGNPPTADVEGIARAGVYRVGHPRKPGMRARWLAVNPVKGESDLTTIGEADWHAALGTRHVRTLPYEQLDGAFARRREMLPALLAAVAVAFALEAGVGAWQAVRRRRHHG